MFSSEDNDLFAGLNNVLFGDMGGDMGGAPGGHGVPAVPPVMRHGGGAPVLAPVSSQHIGTESAPICLDD